MSERRSTVSVLRAGPRLAGLALAVGLCAFVGPARSAGEVVECGALITHDIKLGHDVGPCPGDGLVVAASGITIHLDGHKVFATQRAHVGVRVAQVSNVTVTGGTVEGFDAGVLIQGGLANTVSKLTVRNNRFGIQLENAESSAHLVEKNTVTENRLTGIFLRRFVSGATIRKNVVNANIGHGIVVAGGSSYNVIEGNEANDNGGWGIALREGEYATTITNLISPVLDMVSPDRFPYVAGIDYHVMDGGVLNLVNKRLVPIEVALHPTATTLSNPNPLDTSTSGCEASDYLAAGFQRGDVALLQRGTCEFEVKLIQARKAGASAVLIMNEGQAPDRLSFDFGTLADDDIVAISTTYRTGFELYNLTRAGPVFIDLRVNTTEDIDIRALGSHHNTISKNSATSTIDYTDYCGTNEWFKNWVTPDPPCYKGGQGLGATADAY